MSALKDIDPDKFTTLPEFDDAIEFVAEECARIELQINTAKGNAMQHGEYADAGWYARAVAALRLTKAKKQTLSRKRADLSKKLKAETQMLHDKDRSQLFINFSREVLTKEQYIQLWKRVDEYEAAL